MIQKVNFSEFCDRFRDMNRDNAFTYEGKRALFDYLEEYEEDTGENVELDVIALCCDFTEYENLEELQGDYPDIKSIEQLQECTIVIPLDVGSFDCCGLRNGGFIIQNY